MQRIPIIMFDCLDQLNRKVGIPVLFFPETRVNFECLKLQE